MAGKAAVSSSYRISERKKVSMQRLTIRFASATAAVALAAVGLAGCTTSEKDSEIKVDTATSAAVPTAAATSTAASEDATEVEQSTVTFTNAYVRAMAEDSDMTAIFGQITNLGDQDVTITGFSASVPAARYEIHEVVDGTMQALPTGLVVPAGETVVLQPGAEHLMLLGVTAPVEAGDTVSVTLTVDGTETVTTADIPVRTVAAGDEEYAY